MDYTKEQLLARLKVSLSIAFHHNFALSLAWLFLIFLAIFVLF